ncbi:MAG: polyprenyl synthetase family protein [Bacteroidales bacterium]|nr:polyprenyl synthetase family protein [Bacteroidales bacterium]
MISEQAIDKAVKDLFGNIEFTAEPAGLYDPLRYMIAIGGKRIRPKLCLMAYSMFKEGFTQGILGPAAGLEVFHTFTLIHDDIMDRSPLRRGCDTVWKKWSPDTAILSGDVMCIDSYKRIAQAPREVLPEVLDLFSVTAAQVCDGQQMDMDFEKVDIVPMDEYMQMIGLKTAVLLACAAKMGAIIGGADAATQQALYDYGYNLGLAFQVADDYLDAYGDQAVFGKPIGGDILNCKKSWLTVKAYEKGASEITSALQSSAPAQEKIDLVKGIYASVDVASEALAEIDALTAKALSFVPGEAMLEKFAHSLTGRTK